LALLRRSFLQSLLGTSVIATGCAKRPIPTPIPPTPPVPGNLPPPQDSGIDHIVIVTMENRSFDHLLGWLPHANTWTSQQPGLTFTDSSGKSYPPQNLGSDYTVCGHPVPNGSYGTPNITAYDGGKMDGFLRVPGNDIYSIGYYTAADVPFLAAFAQAYTTCDHWFAPILAETFPNRMFLLAGQTDRLSNTISLSSLPTIFDRLSSAGVSHRYYFANLPFLSLWGLKYLPSSSLFSDLLEHAASGNLPAVAFVDPRFTIFDDGLGNDDHPHSDIRNADAFLSRVFHAIAAGPKWSSTVLIVTFDEWGGFFDHVAPPLAVPANNVDTYLSNGRVLLGFRVPAIIASRFTRADQRVDSTVYDHTSILKLIEWRWNLKPLTARDALANNPAANFAFNSHDVSVPPLPEPATVPGGPCSLRALTSKTQPSNVQEPAATEFAALANAQKTREWMDHPRFKAKQQ
jgi:phospholipase C